MHAEGDAAALLAPAALPSVLAEGAAAALLAPAAPPPVLTYGAAAALLAVGAPPPVLADAAAAALLAVVALPPVLAENHAFGSRVRAFVRRILCVAAKNITFRRRALLINETTTRAGQKQTNRRHNQAVSRSCGTSLTHRHDRFVGLVVVVAAHLLAAHDDGVLFALGRRHVGSEPLAEKAGGHRVSLVARSGEDSVGQLEKLRGSRGCALVLAVAVVVVTVSHPVVVDLPHGMT